MYIIEKIKEPWGTLRIFKLVLSGFILYDSISNSDWLFVGLSAFLFYQAVVNQQCGACATGNNCSIDKTNKSIKS